MLIDGDISGIRSALGTARKKAGEGLKAVGRGAVEGATASLAARFSRTEALAEPSGPKIPWLAIGAAGIGIALLLRWKR